MTEEEQRPSSVQEILERVRDKRRSSSVQSDASGSEVTERTNRLIEYQDREHGERPRNVETGLHATDGYTEINRGRANGNIRTDGSTIRADASSNGSTYQDNQHATTDAGRATAATDTSTGDIEYTGPVKQGRFKYAKEYIQAFKDRQGEKKKKPRVKAAPKIKQYNKLEQAERREKLIEIITWTSDNFDQFIIATTKGHFTVIIWSDMDIGEIAFLADRMLKRAQKDPVVAQAVDRLVDVMDDIRAGVILAPRMFRTVMTYMQRGIGIT